MTVGLSIDVSTRLSSLCRSSEDLSPLFVGELWLPSGDSPGVEVAGLLVVLEFLGGVLARAGHPEIEGLI